MIESMSLTMKTFPALQTSRFPAVFDPDGCYPYTQFVQTAAEALDKTYEVFRLRNAHLSVLVCPALGGRVLSIVEHRTGKELLYRNDVVKPARILPRWGWSPGGIEFNLPIAHSPTALEPVGFRLSDADGRTAIQVGETERRYGLSWIVELSLGEDDEFLTQRTFITNRGSLPRPWCLWTNASIRATPNTRFLFPPSNHVLRHAHVVETVHWPAGGRAVKDFNRMEGLFWEAQGVAFGAWHPDEQIGLLHLSDPTVLRGMKLWTYGLGPHTHWCAEFTDAGEPYAEIQSGAAQDQGRIELLNPGEERCFIEFWKPLYDETFDLAAATLPQCLTPFPDHQYLGGEHSAELEPWLDVKQHYDDPVYVHTTGLFRSVPSSPPPPLPEYEKPLRKAYADNPHVWGEALATYLCALHQQTGPSAGIEYDYRSVLEIARNTATPGALRIAGLILWKQLDDAATAVTYLERAYRLSGDVALACELDACCAAAGDHARREAWHCELATLMDGRWVERRVDHLLSTQKPHEAKHLLLQKRWDVYHLRNVRSQLYRRCQRALGEAEFPIPEILGEDDMAEWGAYRPQSHA